MASVRVPPKAPHWKDHCAGIDLLSVDDLMENRRRERSKEFDKKMADAKAAEAKAKAEAANVRKRSDL